MNMTERTIKILIAHQSPQVIMSLSALINAQPDMSVIYETHDGIAVVEKAKSLRPDLILMGIELANIHGETVTKMIMEDQAMPIILVGNHKEEKQSLRLFDALSYGAITVLPSLKPDSSGELKSHILNSIRIHTNTCQHEKLAAHSHPNPEFNPRKAGEKTDQQQVRIIGIGASTGGPKVLKNIFDQLKTNHLPPIVVVLHISKGFLPTLIDWLQQTCPLTISVAKQNEGLLENHIYFAPDNYHLTIHSHEDKPSAFLTKKYADIGYMPSANILFESLATNFAHHSLGLLLTGMGTDGALGLLEMKKAGGSTIIQDKDSSIIFGMPGYAKEIHAADKELSPNGIAQYLLQLTG